MRRQAGQGRQAEDKATHHEGEWTTYSDLNLKPWDMGDPKAYADPIFCLQHAQYNTV